MGQRHAQELRVQVIAFVKECHSNRKAARHFRVSPRFVNNFVKLKAATGSLQPHHPGHAPGGGRFATHTAFVRRRMEEAGDLTLDELGVELTERGLSVHRSSVGRLLHRLGSAITNSADQRAAGA
ncbi:MULTISPECIES: transposase [unclassified Aminobacter]|uniref:transposase n=1 Tax=unclassified Aminobacter TaxID=2644704 RepID=UPI0004651919|nr:MULTISPECIES: transposase [unclassified Aminobacter]TWH28086.1 transposase [Aminobacter sp. J15]